MQKSLSASSALFRLAKGDAETTYNAIISILESFNLKVEQVRGQCYDGASTMSGSHRGVQERFKTVERKALDIHCANHALNLVLVDVIHQSDSFAQIFDLINCVFSFFTKSHVRNSKLEEAVSRSGTTGPKSLKRIVSTRWSSSHDAVNTLLNIFVPLIEVLEEEKELSAIAQGIYSGLKDYSKLILLLVVRSILSKINPCVKFLQSGALNFQSTLRAVSELQSSFREMKNNFDTWFSTVKSTAEELCAVCGIPCEYRSKRIGSESTDPESVMKNIIIASFDLLITEIDERFQAFSNVMINFDCFSEKDRDKFKRLTETYSTDVNRDNLETEWSTYELVYASNDLSSEMPITEIYKALDSKSFFKMLPNIRKLMEIGLCIPSTSVICERSFSKLKLIKSFLRSSMSQDRLCDLALVNIEQQLSKSIDSDELLNVFLKSNRRF